MFAFSIFNSDTASCKFESFIRKNLFKMYWNVTFLIAFIFGVWQKTDFSMLGWFAAVECKQPVLVSLVANCPGSCQADSTVTQLSKHELS